MNLGAKVMLYLFLLFFAEPFPLFPVERAPVLETDDDAEDAALLALRVTF
jgi:hypothetical protein